MSLLLDALKPTEPDSDIGVEPDASEIPEEPLDGPATLALLSSKPIAQTTLTLVPTSSVETAPAASAAEQFNPGLVEAGLLESGVLETAQVAPVQAAVAAPEPVIDPAPAAENPERASPIAAPRSAQPAPTPRPPAAPAANTRAPVSAPAAKPRAKTFALACAALAALAGVGILGKSLWWPSEKPFNYPAPRASQPAPADIAPEATPSTAAVQVSSARPADQFADAGYAPEINLRDPEQPTDATPPTSVGHRGLRGTAPHSPIATLSVTRSEGLPPIDQHVQAGYQALGAGRVANAQTEYAAALALDPNNVDALFGAATVAAREGRAKDAAAAYGKVLRLEPGNPDATAAMTALGATGSTGENDESRLKILIAGGDGDRPALHAALAGVYAADSRWSEAAQEYFTALAKDPGNPDLAFDLAASLDQNRNAGMALAYYGQTLIFARQRPTQIDLHAVEQRMSQLQAHMERAPVPETP